MAMYEDLMAGLNDALDHAKGTRELRTVKMSFEPVKQYNAAEIRQIRMGLGMTQSLFAGFMGVSLKTVEAWEAGRNMPDGPARRILGLVEADPQLPQRYNIIHM